MNPKKQSIIPGIVLIGVGVILLLPKISSINAWDHVFPVFLIAMALTCIIETARNNSRNALVWGVMLFLVGAFLALRNFDVIPYLYFDEYWPLFLAAAGLGIILKNILYKDQARSSAVTGIILVAAGLFFLLFTLPYDFEWFTGAIENFWPVVLLIIGLFFIVSGLRAAKNSVDVTGGSID